MSDLHSYVRTLEERAEHELAVVQRLTGSKPVVATSVHTSEGAAAITSALAHAHDDPGALFETSVLTALRNVRAADPADYQRIRAKAKKAKVSVGELDRLTLPPKSESGTGLFAPIEPWPAPVDGAVLVSDLNRTLNHYVVADEPTILAATLWCIHSWCMDMLTVSPLAHISAPEKRCGKTLLLTAMNRLVYRPLAVSNISPSAIFRSLEAWQPTLLIDEADSFLRENDEARGLINSGLYRENAFVLRVEGDAHIPTQFRTWGAKVICGIGKLADTIEDRAIPLRLRRKVAGETVANLRHADPALWDDLRRRIARWVADHRDVLAAARPVPAAGLHDRACDLWEPLLAIADLTGEPWANTARKAAQALHGIDDEVPSINVELLNDIREAFARQAATRLPSGRLLDVLAADEERPWGTWNHGKAMTACQLARRLDEFRIKPKLKRAGGEPSRGYDLADFEEVFRRYLSGPTAVSAVTPLQSHRGAVCEGATSVTDTHPVTKGDASQTAPTSQCNGVTGRPPAAGQKEPGLGAKGEGFAV